jgi:predicted transcriptional regulator
MSEPLEGEIKARVPLADKKRLQQLADSRHLKLSDLLREAIREKIQYEKIRK